MADDPNTPTPTSSHLEGLTEVREFTLGERKLMTEVMARHDLEELGKRIAEDTTVSSLEAQNDRIKVAEKIVAKLEGRIDKLLEQDVWDANQLETLTNQLVEARSNHHELIKAGLPSQMESAEASNALYVQMLEAQDAACMEVFHAVATARGVEVPALEELLESATGVDFDFVARFVETGAQASPLNRAGRRARKRKGDSRVLN